MAFTQKIEDKPYICGVLLSYDSAITPQVSADILQNFFDTEITSPDLQAIYTTSSKSSFNEQSASSRSGTIYTQSVSISMPVGSISRSIDIAKLHLVSHLVLKLTNGRYIFIGRNDSQQNTRPKVKYQADQKIGTFQFETKTMFPVGYTDLESVLGFPFLIPN